MLPFAFELPDEGESTTMPVFKMSVRFMGWVVTAALLQVAWQSLLLAHDTWVQTNTNLVRTGDHVHIDLMLGNHGNEHRDFKLASKITLPGCKLDVITPSGKSFSVMDRLVDVGYTPKEGFWSARFAGNEAGIYTVAHFRDGNHGTTRSIKSGKAFYVMSDSLDKVPLGLKGYQTPLGHPLEIVPMVNPVVPMGPGKPIKVQVLYKGKPLENAVVSFIPRGAQLTEEFDSEHERKTKADGIASYTPKEGNYILVCVHQEEPNEKGEGFDSTKYSATLTVFVPELCPCCAE